MQPQSDRHKTSRIVVVNDDPTQLGILVGILEKKGFTAQGYAAAEQALRAMHKQTPPDLIVTDLYMPGIDGWRFCRLLRSLEFKDLNGVPIIVVSATFSGDETALVTSELGASAFLSAPVDADELINVVGRVLQGERIEKLPRMLIVDDSKSLVRALREVFEASAYTVDVALTGQDALEAFGENHYDLAVLDYHLPDIMGSALLQIFRRQRLETVCVMITTDTRPKLALEWMQAGAAAYVRKPFDPDYLVQVCEGARRERSQLRVKDLLEQRTRELRQSEALQRTLLQSLPAGMVIVDAATMVIEQVNDHVSLMHGAPVDHLIGQQCHALLCPADSGACPVCDLGQIVDHSEREMLRADGARLPILKTVRKIQLDGRDKLLECFTDLSRQKRIEGDLRKSENRYRRLVNNLPDIVYIYSDLRGGVFWSPGVETVLGYTVDHMHANPFLWNESIHPEDKEKVTGAIIESSRGKPFEIEYRIQDARGDWLWLHDRSTARITRDGETFIEGIARDVTKRNLAEEEVRSINAQLHKANADKDMLFSIIAHDLKSPVSGLVGSTAILSREFDLMSQQDARQLLDGLHKSAMNIAALLDDLLQWSLMSQGGMAYAPAPRSLDEVIDASLVTARDAAKSKDIVIRDNVASGLTVLVDQPMINTVIRNILSNAVKFTHRGGEIVITARQEGRNVTMAIQDSGTGMDEQTLAGIFSIQDKTRHVGTEGEKGTGLGLVLCRQFIEKHGGQIWLESKPGHGTTVFSTLPAP